MLNLLITAFLFLMLSQPVPAQEREFSIYQGVISSTERLPGYLIINEREIPLADDVEVKDSREKEVSLSDLKAGKWVYIVSEQSSDSLIAKRIYLLPKHIKKNEKQDYPFMKREEESSKK
jgi:hypothetical protein